MNDPRDKNLSSLTVEELAKRLKCPFTGNGKTRITGVASLENSRKGDLVFLGHPKHKTLLEKAKASAAIIPKDYAYTKKPAILSENPYLSFIRAVELFFTPYRPEPGVHSTAFIDPSAKIGSNVSIGAFVCIDGEAEIGDGTVIFPFASIYPRVQIGSECVIHSHVAVREDVRIGNRVVIHNGAVIGADGFGYIQIETRTRIKIPQKGNVIIEDDVEIGANSTVDRSALDATIIKKGTKIDNLVQVAHNVEIGTDSVLAAQTGIAGSTKIGKNVVLAGQVGVADHLKLGDNVVAAAKTGITKTIPANVMVSGSPHLEIREWRKAWASIPRLYDLIREVRRLKKRVEELENKPK